MLYKCKLYHSTAHDPTEPVWSVSDEYLAKYKQAALLCPACGQIMEPVENRTIIVTPVQIDRLNLQAKMLGLTQADLDDLVREAGERVEG